MAYLCLLKWLIKNGREIEARSALRTVYKENSVGIGMNRLANSRENKVETLLEKNPSLKQMLCSKTYRKMMRISLGLNIGQQTCGSAIVLIYSTKMFENMGGGKFFARVMTLIIGILSLISGLLAIFILKWVGRKTMLVYGTLGSAISLLCLGFFSGIIDGGIVVSSLLIFIYIFVFTMTMGSVFWAYVGEVLNDKAMSIGLTSNIFTIIALSFAFPFANFYLGISSCFFIFSGFAFILFLYQIFDLVETRGLTKQEINKKILNN